MNQLLLTLLDLQNRLEGATVLNIYLLHKLGGSMTVHRKDLEQVVKDFPHLVFSAKDDDIYIKVSSCESQGHGKHTEVPE